MLPSTPALRPIKSGFSKRASLIVATASKPTFILSNTQSLLCIRAYNGSGCANHQYRSWVSVTIWELDSKSLSKNFHWHVSGPHFRDYHLLLDEHGDQIFAITDAIAERVRKIGGMTIRSIGEISRVQRIQDNDAEFVTPLDMLAELRDDNKELVAKMRATHALCEEHNDVATANSLEVWIDEAERRTWFLFEATKLTESA